MTARSLQFTRRAASEFRRQRIDHLQVVAGLECGCGHERAAADLGERELQFAQSVGRIDRHQDQPGLCRGKLRQRPFGTVQRPDADAVASLEAEREQTGCDRVDLVGEAAPAQTRTVARRHQRFALAPPRSRAVERFADRHPEQRSVRCSADVAQSLLHICL